MVLLDFGDYICAELALLCSGFAPLTSNKRATLIGQCLYAAKWWGGMRFVIEEIWEFWFDAL
jgi:hypothetical protein